MLRSQKNVAESIRRHCTRHLKSTPSLSLSLEQASTHPTLLRWPIISPLSRRRPSLTFMISHQSFCHSRTACLPMSFFCPCFGVFDSSSPTSSVGSSDDVSCSYSVESHVQLQNRRRRRGKRCMKSVWQQTHLIQYKYTKDNGCLP
jgi:hypothetical protein